MAVPYTEDAAGKCIVSDRIFFLLALDWMKGEVLAEVRSLKVKVEEKKVKRWQRTNK